MTKGHSTLERVESRSLLVWNGRVARIPAERHETRAVSGPAAPPREKLPRPGNRVRDGPDALSSDGERC